MDASHDTELAKDHIFEVVSQSEVLLENFKDCKSKETRDSTEVLITKSKLGIDQLEDSSDIVIFCELKHSGPQEVDASFFYPMVLRGKAFSQDKHTCLSCRERANFHSVLSQLLEDQLYDFRVDIFQSLA